MFTHFSEQFGQPTQGDVTSDWEAAGLPRLLQHLEEEFTGKEMHAVIQDFKSDKFEILWDPVQ